MEKDVLKHAYNLQEYTNVASGETWGEINAREWHDQLTISWQSGDTTHKLSQNYRVRHVHVYIPNPKFSQAFKFADFKLGPNNELVSKYQFWPLATRVPIWPLLKNMCRWVIHAWRIWLNCLIHTSFRHCISLYNRYYFLCRRINHFYIGSLKRLTKYHLS